MTTNFIFGRPMSHNIFYVIFEGEGHGVKTKVMAAINTCRWPSVFIKRIKAILVILFE